MNQAGAVHRPGRSHQPLSGAELEVRHLRVLVALAEEGTFTDAAVRLGITQPAVSRALARLEAILGVQLLTRTTRSLSLTEPGQACYDAAITALVALDSVRYAALGRVRPLRLGYAWAAFGRHTSTVLRAWREEHPEVPLEVHRIDERSAGLSTHQVDVAIRRDSPVPGSASSGPAGIDPSLHLEPIFTESRTAALPLGSPLADRAWLALTDLADAVIALSPAAGTTTLQLWPERSRPSRSVEVSWPTSLLAE